MKGITMKIAVPTAQGKLCMHFGHCESFALVSVDEATNTITDRQDVIPPPHEPGLLPRWLHEQGATRIIAGGMGSRAQQLFSSYGIEVVVGAPSLDPDEVVNQWLGGSLVTGVNGCDH